MTLQRFLVGVSESRWFWLGLKRWKPAPDQSWNWVATLVHVARVGILAAAFGTAVYILARPTPMGGSSWPLAWAVELGLIVSLMMVGTVGVAWNRRRAQLGREAVSPTTLRSTGLAPLRAWQRWLLGPIYAFLLFVLTPFYIWFTAGNALGARAWQQTRASMTARGIPLTPESLTPAMPTESENFAMTPLLRPLLEYELIVTNARTDARWADRPGYLRVQAVGVLPQPVEPKKPAVSGPSGRVQATNDGRYDLLALARGIRARPLRTEPADLPPEIAARYGVATNAKPALTTDEARALEIADPATEVLEYLKRYEPEMTEIEAAVRRPVCRFPIHWDEGIETLLPHLAPMKHLSALFRTRAAARLAKGDAAGGFLDTQVVLRLGEMLSREPLLMSHLVHLSQRQAGLAAVWEGLAGRHWSEAQLAELQESISRIDPRESVVVAYQGERIFMNRSFEGMLQNPAPFGLMNAAVGEIPRPASPRFLPGLRPVGFLRRNQIASNRLYDDLVAQVQDPAWPATLASASDKDADAALLRRTGLTPVSPHTFLASQLAPAVSRSHAKGARLFASTRLAEVACALERFRLGSGRLPDKLEELVPRFLKALPLDPMNRKPFRYQRTDDGWYRLWSVGLNGQDDGGVMKTSEKDRLGDWVWPVPVPSTEPRLFR